MKSFLALTLFSATAFALVAPRTGCRAGRQTINGQLYTVSCGLDRFGGDTGRDSGITFGQCQANCAADSTCVTAQYHENISTCYYKNSVNPAVLSNGHDTIDLGVGCQSGTQTFNGVQCTITCSQDSHGGNYAASYVGNFLGCAQACSADSNCKTAQYNEENGYCYLKNAINGFVSSDNTDSVVCKF